MIGTSNVGYVDNVIVQLADHDRSVHGGVKDTFSGTNGLSSGLKVNGTIVKEPVATGSDLVYYRNFSNTNYFSQPYNSALDFGTGDLCIMFWIKNTQNDAYDDLIARRAHNGSAYTGNGWYIQMGNDQNITLKDSVGGSRGAIPHFVYGNDGNGCPSPPSPPPDWEFSPTPPAPPPPADIPVFGPA